MKSTVVIAVAGLAIAQILPIDLPQCAVKCLVPAVGDIGCASLDHACGCEQQGELWVFAYRCFQSSCWPEELQMALNAVRAFCNRSSSSSSAPSSGAASPTAASSSSSVSSPSTSTSSGSATSSSTAASIPATTVSGATGDVASSIAATPTSSMTGSWTSPPSSPKTHSGGSTGLSGGAIGGIVTGAVVLLLLAGVWFARRGVIAFFSRNGKRNNNVTSEVHELTVPQTKQEAYWVHGNGGYAYQNPAEVDGSRPQPAELAGSYHQRST